jgi:dTMP kinase
MYESSLTLDSLQLTVRGRKGAIEAKKSLFDKKEKRGIPHFEDSVRNDAWAFFSGIARAALQRRMSAVRLSFDRSSHPVMKVDAGLYPPVNRLPLGRLIAIEGIDGSGKRTQLDLLAAALAAGKGGPSIFTTGFPQYDSWFGKMIGQFLNGELGPLENVDPHFTAMLYAGDRFEAKPKLETALNNGQIVLVDRYIGSNLAHQTARVPVEKRSAFRHWIEHLEYGIYGLPREDLILYLRVPPKQAQSLVAQKSARTYTTAKQDILEANLRHLEQAAEMYDLLCREAPWVTIECYDSASGAMRPPKNIAQEVLAAVNKVTATQVVRDSSTGVS